MPTAHALLSLFDGTTVSLPVAGCSQTSRKECKEGRGGRAAR